MNDDDTIFDRRTGTWMDRYRTFQQLPSNTRPYTPSEAGEVLAALQKWLQTHDLDISLAIELWTEIRAKADWAVWKYEIERATTDPKFPADFRAKAKNPNQHRDLYEELYQGRYGQMLASQRRLFLRGLRKRTPAEDVTVRDAFIEDVAKILYAKSGKLPGVSSSNSRQSESDFVGPGRELFRALLRPFSVNLSDARVRALLIRARKALKENN